MASAQVLVAASDAMAKVQVSGRATFACSGDFRDFCLAMLEDDTRLAIDLSACKGMDSTFMGMLSKVGRQALAAGRQVEIVNAGDSLKRLLRGLGIAQLFAFTHTTTDEVDWTALCHTERDDLSQAQTMLEAHEELADVNPENIPKFKDVVEFLIKDINRIHDETAAGSSP
jgi:anti-anti-sigma regulatory factor